MLNNQGARDAVAKGVDPIAKRLVAAGITSDTVTYVGTAATCAAALWFFPQGQFIPGVILIAIFALSDLLDGTMARMTGTAGPWGNFLDSTLDRIADGAVFGSILIYFATHGNGVATAAAWVCLVGGLTTSYAKARAESIGIQSGGVGIAERAERLIIVLVAAFLQGLGVFWSPLLWALPVALVVLAVLSVVTIGQRFAHVRREITLREKSPASDDGAEPA
jgi:CDP-diacylglycerol--glycerol-3-phosphate 3-phosphatidyltransferase